MNKCRKDCICLKCKLLKTELCKYGDCQWCKGKDGVFKCKYFKQRRSLKCLNTETKKSLNKYEILTADLKEAKEKVINLIGEFDDREGANLYSVFLTLRSWKEKDVLEAIRAAGLSCNGKSKWIGQGYHISINIGQGDNKRLARNEFMKVLDEKGYKALAFDNAN